MNRWLTAALVLLWPSAAQACSVCFSATEQNRIAYIVTTIVMSLLPLGMIGGGIYWLHRRSHRLGDDGNKEG